MDLSGLAFFPNAAALYAQVQAARIAYNTSGQTGSRRLLQVGGGALPALSQQVTLQTELVSEVLGAINLYMAANKLGVSSLTSQSVVVTALSPASVVAGLSFQYTGKTTQSGPQPISPITAAGYFAQALHSPVTLVQLANCTV